MGDTFMIRNIHGGDIYSRNIKYDFSANINPLGMPQNVKNSIMDHVDDFEHYPDANCRSLKEAIAKHENIDVENIVCGNGAADLIYRIVYTLKPKKALVLSPTFSEYEKALSSVGCITEHHLLLEEDNFTLNDRVLERLCNIDIVFMCNPNNPVGNLISRDLMACIVKKCSENNIYLIIDECFMDFVKSDKAFNVKADRNNIIVLKAFTKIYAMAGLRLGYIFCSDVQLVEQIQNCGQCWSVSVAAQIAGIEALKEKSYVEKTIMLISEEREYLTEKLKKFGFKVYPSETNFILFRCRLPLDKLLLNEQIAIRNCNNYIGLEQGYFRIAVRTHTENEILINAIERIIKND